MKPAQNNWLEAGSAEHAQRRHALAAITREMADTRSSEPPWLAVAGSCMSPRIEEGDRVRLETRRAYLPGDVLAFFSRNGRLQVHRLLGYRPVDGVWCCVTAADRVGGSDHPVPLSQVLGRVCAIGAAHGEESFGASFVERLRSVARFGGLAMKALLRRVGVLKQEPER